MGPSRVKGSHSVNLEALEAPLLAALERMQALPESSRPFVIVDHLASGRFVQFCGGDGAPLRFDVPRLSVVGVPCLLKDAPALAAEALRTQGVPSAAQLVICEDHTAGGTA